MPKTMNYFLVLVNLSINHSRILTNLVKFLSLFWLGKITFKLIGSSS